MSFAPPASDYSVVFLGNLFGVVDGVLSGSGSQIMGAMFGVLNAAVLALGGIVILYTLIVATMNTAHEGQMLGQKVVLHLDSNSLYNRFGIINPQSIRLLHDADFCDVGCSTGNRGRGQSMGCCA
ncbi:hypothetical protein [Legionella sainthelensi]|uniref:hypothetical protein n=1 Tax=Legionella sainthelensi TaxID=28087 RepID=UPI001F541B3F|nr:hypothetical protein [Legionella sainthelensi]